MTYKTPDNYIFIKFAFLGFSRSTKTQSQHTIIFLTYYQCDFTVTIAVKSALNSIITIFPYLEDIFGSCFQAKEGKK